MIGLLGFVTFLKKTSNQITHRNSDIITTMKINTTTKTFIEIEITLDDAKTALKNYQKDMLDDLSNNFSKTNAPGLCYYEFYYNLLQGENTEWFQDLVEKYGIYWITTPGNTGEWVNFIEQFPHMVIKDIENVLRPATVDNLTITFEGLRVDSQTVMDNL